MVLTRSGQLALPPFKGSGIITSSLTANNGFSKPNAPSIVGFRAPMTDNNNHLSRSAGSFSSNASSVPSSPLLMWENMDMGMGMGMGMHEWPPNNVLMEPGLIQCQPPIVLPNYQLGHHHGDQSPSIDSSSNYCCSPPISGLSRIPSLASLNTASSSSTSSSSAPALLSDPISPLADVVTQYIVFSEQEEQEQEQEDGSRKSTARVNCNVYGMQTCWDALLSCEGGPSLPLCNNNGFAAGLAKAPQPGFEHEPQLCSNELEQILSYVSTQENWETSSNSTSHLHTGSVLTRSNDKSIQYCIAKLAEPKPAADRPSSRKRPACNRLEELLEGVPAGCKAINIGSTSTTPPIPSPTPVAGRVNNNNNNKQRRRNGTATDPQSVAARMRRERFSERIRILQGLVPKGERLDTVSMLGQTLEYVRFLQHRVSELYHTTATCAPSQSSLTPAQRNKWKDFLEEPLLC